MSLKRNLLENSFASFFQKGVIVLDKLFLVPFFIQYWGVEYYGEWLTLTIVPSFLAFSQLGFGNAASNIVVLRYAGGDKQGAANMVKSALVIISTLIVAGMLLSVLVISTLNYFEIFDKTLLDPEEAMIALSVLMLARLANFYQQLFEAYFRAARKAAKSINLLTVYAFINVMAGLAVLVSGGGIVQFALANLIVSLFFNPIYALLGIKTLKLGRLKKAAISREDITQAFQKGLGFLASPIWQAVFFQGTTLAVRLVIGPEGVTIFNTIRALTRSVNQVFTIISGSVFPELQFEIGNGNMAMARQLFRMSTMIIFLVAIFGMLFLSVFGLWFYAIWTTNVLNPPASMWYIFVLSIGFNALWWNSTMVFRATNEPYKMAIAGTAAASISVVTTYAFSIFWGLTGAALGAMTLDFLLALYILPVSSRLLGQNPAKILVDFFRLDLMKIKKTFKFKC